MGSWGGGCSLAAWASDKTHPSISGILIAFSCYPHSGSWKLPPPTRLPGNCSLCGVWGPAAPACLSTCCAVTTQSLKSLSGYRRRARPRSGFWVHQNDSEPLVGQGKVEALSQWRSSEGTLPHSQRLSINPVPGIHPLRIHN